MSENWNKKHLHNRLDSMFSDLEESDNLPGLSIFSQLDGWTWEIDAEGNLKKCSPDVVDLLGFKPESLLNQPIAQISDIETQIDTFSKQLADASSPEKYEINFYHSDGSRINTSTYIAPIFNPQESFMGWTGMTVIEAQETQMIISEDKNVSEADLPVPLQDFISPDGPIEPTPVEPPREELPKSETETVQEESFQVELKDVHSLLSDKPRQKIIDILRTIDDDPNRAWEPEEIQLVEQVQNQMELALENAKLFQQTQLALAETDEQARRLRLLNELSERLSQTSTLDEIYDISTKITHDIFGASSTVLATWSDDPAILEICASVGDFHHWNLGQKIHREQRIFYQPIEDFRIQITADYLNHSLPEIRALIVGPIYTTEERLGVLLVGRSEPQSFDKQDESFMAQLLSIINSVVENRKLFEAIESALATTEEQARRLAELNKLSEMLSRVTAFEEVITNTMEMMDYIIPCKVCQTAIWSNDLEAFTLFDLDDGRAVETGHYILSEKTLVGAVTTQKKLIKENDLSRSLFSDAEEIAEAKDINTLIAAPLLSGEQAIGAVLVGNTSESAFTSRDETLLQSITSIMVSTLENRRLFRQIQRRSIQLETSAEVSRIASTILDPSELLPEVVELIKKGFDLYYAGIFLIDDTGEITGEPYKWAVLQAGSGMAGQQMLQSGHKLEIGGESMIGTSISQAEARIALDVGKEAIFFRNPYLPETRSEMALPLISRGRVLGALTIQSNKERSFTPEDITSLQTMSDQLANAIENAHLFEQTEARAEELTILNEMARAFTQTMDVDELFRHTHNFTGRLMDAENFYAALFYPETQTIEFKLFVEDGEQIPAPEPIISLGEGLTDWIIKNQLPLLMQSNVTEQMISMGIEPRGRPAESWLGVPMLIGNQVLGVIAVQAYIEDIHYNDHDLGLLSAVASQAAVAIDNALRFQKTQAKAKFEQVMREITTRVHSSTNAETILKTAVREVSSALGRQAYIELNPDPNGKKMTSKTLTEIKGQDLDSTSTEPKSPIEPNAQES